MEKGKEKCELLKAIRAYVAEKYGLEYTASECAHKGDCQGTCPKCDSELASLQRQLEAKGIADIVQDDELSKMVANFLSTESKEEADFPLGGIHAPHGDVDSDNDMMTLECDIADTGLKASLEGMPMPLEGDVIPPDENPQFQRRMILECPVAGIAFHDINDIWDELYVGAEIALVRDSDNKYDTNAVAVALAGDYDGNPENFDFDYILGYIPRKDNQTIAAMLDMGWQDLIEAEISEMNDHAPYNDRLHITVYIRSKEPQKPKDNRLRIKTFDDDEEWSAFIGELWDKGVSFFRWGGFPPWELDLPEKGDKVVFLLKGDDETKVYLMMVIALGDDCAPFVDDPERLHMIDDCGPYVLSVVKGPLYVKNEELAFLDGLPADIWQPDFKLDKDASDALMEMVKNK